MAKRLIWLSIGTAVAILLICFHARSSVSSLGSWAKGVVGSDGQLQFSTDTAEFRLRELERMGAIRKKPKIVTSWGLASVGQVRHRFGHGQMPTSRSRTDVVKEVHKPPRTDACPNGLIYIYDLPPMFNNDFLANCAAIHRTVDMCEAFSHSGVGWPSGEDAASGKVLIPPHAWYATDQFSLEITFHERMKELPCLTSDPLEATLFYIPFYPGLAIFRSLYEKDKAEKDKHGHAIVDWLAQFPWWHRHEGRDHLLVVTRVIIDFTRGVVRDDWGNGLLKMSHFLNCSVLGIEAHGKRHKLPNAHSIPYPSSFHPSTDEDIRRWQDFVRNYRKEHTVVFGGTGRGMGTAIRHLLWKACTDHPDDCFFYSCRDRACIMKPHNVMWFYLSGKFCFQPPGDTPTRKGLFDCMLAGGIPVTFHRETFALYEWHLPSSPEDEVLVYIPSEGLTENNIGIVIDKVRAIPPEKVARMQENIIKLIPDLIYSMPGNTVREFRDAFHIAVGKVMDHVNDLKLPYYKP
eukprot:TRINITY_DN38848_c0_g1_i1.p1 TRINITY_DN38848_c0_g1~~TRINITY_DN38848_c0_g1_i1.p1  ORF type:complete len:517 (+),score=40.66 TRINITY_DN38848_c0_g1_i1:544-2094(+)